MSPFGLATGDTNRAELSCLELALEGSVMLADDCAVEAILDDPSDEEAHLIRAITRLVRWIGDQEDGPNESLDTDSLKEMLDRFGFPLVGRHPLAFEADFPEPLPENSPTGGDVQDFLRTVFLAEITGAIEENFGYPIAQIHCTAAINYMINDLQLNIDTDRIYMAGFSMGGSQSLTLALRNPDRFGSVCSLSGAIHRSNLMESYEILRHAGRTNEAFRQLYITCCDGDGLSEAAAAFHEQLREAGIRHKYLTGPGGHAYMHDWPFLEAFLAEFAPPTSVALE